MGTPGPRTSFDEWMEGFEDTGIPLSMQPGSDNDSATSFDNFLDDLRWLPDDLDSLSSEGPYPALNISFDELINANACGPPLSESPQETSLTTDGDTTYAVQDVSPIVGQVTVPSVYGSPDGQYMPTSGDESASAYSLRSVGPSCHAQDEGGLGTMEFAQPSVTTATEPAVSLVSFACLSLVDRR
ncbi:hypothetical protein K402DRAFT_233350 [Aulographum hederae CBS 113979]|uniref:Uncharacterized protein n=1 Tax=Aulographum hederae CBS 113979 TaxID=1176131 RepID=A0A6G1GL24_9PEZI|nr:hypothetical protein K402DRAFT_233350 [Aulographum hederae CBS 113979]